METPAKHVTLGLSRRRARLIVQNVTLGIFPRWMAQLLAHLVPPGKSAPTQANRIAPHVPRDSRLWERQAQLSVHLVPPERRLRDCGARLLAPLARKGHGQKSRVSVSVSRATKPTGAPGVTPAPKDTRETPASSARKTGTCSKMTVILANRTRDFFFSSSSACRCLPYSSQRWYFQAK